MCNGTTKAKQKRLTENAEPHVGCTNKPGIVRGTWSVIVTIVSGLHAHKGKPTTPKAISGLFSSFLPKNIHLQILGKQEKTPVGPSVQVCVCVCARVRV